MGDGRSRKKGADHVPVSNIYLDLPRASHKQSVFLKNDGTKMGDSPLITLFRMGRNSTVSSHEPLNRGGHYSVAKDSCTGSASIYNPGRDLC